MRNSGSVEIYNFSNLGNHASAVYSGLNFAHISTVRHQHLDFYEIILVTSGEFLHSYDNVATIIPTGTLLLFKPGMTHQLFTEANNSVHFVMCIEQRYFEKRTAAMFPDFDLNSFDKFLSKPITKDKATYIERLGNVINRDRKANVALAEEILFLSLADFASHNSSMDYEYYIDDIIRKLDRLQYMNATAKEIYAKYPYSESVLLREFKKRTGMTIVEYRTQQKMRYACQLLTETNTRVLGIALSLNYTSLSYFVRAFRKVYGMNPAEYRRLHKKEDV